MSTLLAATERPTPGHYELLAALPPSRSNERPVGWPHRARLIIIAFTLGMFALGLGHRAIDVIADMIGK